MDPFSALISAGANIFSGILGSNSAKANNEAQMQMAQQNIALQKEFAQKGVQWKASDAREAERLYGINPLVSMGASTSTFSPVSVGLENPGEKMGAGIAGAGQDLSRAAEAMSASNVRKARLEEDLLRAKIANTNSDTVRNTAAASDMAKRGQQKAPGLGPLYTQYKDPEGNVITLPSEKASTALQNVASWPANLAVGLDMTARNMGIRHPIDDARKWIAKHGPAPVRGDVWRMVDPASYNWVPF